MKRVMIAFLFVLAAGAAMCDYIEAPKEAPEFKYEPNTDSVSQWVILGVDAVSAAFAVWAVLDAEDYIKKYNDLHAEIDDGTQENYEILYAKQMEAEKRASAAAIACAASGVFIIYTLADYFFVKEIFPEGLRLFYDTPRSAGMLAYSMKF